MTVSDRFSILSRALQPTTSGVERTDLHRMTIKSRLESSFSLSKLLTIGSASRQSAIRSASDVDLLAVFSRVEVRRGNGYVTSDTLVNRVRQDLGARYTSTAVRRDGQAIVLGFAQGERSFDVVPGYFHEFRGGAKAPVYMIPNGSGGWLETAPEAHGRYLAAANVMTAGKLRKTVQFIKHWKSCRSTPIALASIYLELFLASQRICVGAKGYSQCLYEGFRALHQHGCRPMVDPVGVAGTLYSVQTQAQGNALLSSVAYAYEHSEIAMRAEARGDVREAVRQWAIVFNNQFPN